MSARALRLLDTNLRRSPFAGAARGVTFRQMQTGRTNPALTEIRRDRRRTLKQGRTWNTIAQFLVAVITKSQQHSSL